MTMRSPFHNFVARRPATAAAIGSTLTAAAAAAVLIAACGPSTSAIFAASLAGVAVAVLAGAAFGALLREHTAALDAAAQRIADLAIACGMTDEGRDSEATGSSSLLAIDRDITAIGRAYRSLQREREQSQNALEQQIARQSEFYAQLSHELRSPLNAILGYASLAIEDAEAGHVVDLPQDLRKIRGAGQNLLALIDNLLQLAEDRTGRETVARAPFSLADLLSQVIAEHKSVVPDTRIALAEAAGREILFGNRTKVARAVGSVIDDAVRSRGAQAIAIATRPSLSHEASVDVMITIEEAGLPAKSGETLTRHLADRLAAAVSGRLSVETSHENPVSYILRLPYDVDAKGDLIARTPIALGDIPAADARGERTALVIDDDPATIELMGRWLERGGYRVVSATNADHGLALAREIAPNIVLLDALMPGCTGYDILPHLTALPELRETPILLVTVDDDRPRGLAAGASDYVRKPVTEGRLREIIAVYEKDLEGEVLIVEDDPDSAEVMERTVHRLGFTTRIARDGAEGLAALAEHTPSAILLDLNMPNLNGFDFIEALGRREELARIPLIVLSGQELSVAQHHRLLAAGVRYYMKGNAAPREIAESLREMVA